MIQRPILVFLVVFFLSFLLVPIGKGQSLDQYTRDLLRLFQYELDDIYDRYGGHNSRVTGEPWPEIIPSDDEIKTTKGSEKIHQQNIKRALEKRYGKNKYNLLEKAREAKDNAIARLLDKYRQKGLMNKLERSGLSLIDRFFHRAEPGKDVFIQDRATKKEVPLRDFVKSLPPKPLPKVESPSQGEWRLKGWKKPGGGSVVRAVNFFALFDFFLQGAVSAREDVVQAQHEEWYQRKLNLEGLREKQIDELAAYIQNISGAEDLSEDYLREVVKKCLRQGNTNQCIEQELIITLTPEQQREVSGQQKKIQVTGVFLHQLDQQEPERPPLRQEEPTI